MDRAKGEVKRPGGGGGWFQTASDQGAAMAPRGEPLVEFFSSPPNRPVDREVRKVAVPQGKGQGILSGIWDTLFMVWGRELGSEDGKGGGVMCRPRGQLRTRRQVPWQKQSRQTLGYTWPLWGGAEEGSTDKGESMVCPTSPFGGPWYTRWCRGYGSWGRTLRRNVGNVCAPSRRDLANGPEPKGGGGAG